MGYKHIKMGTSFAFVLLVFLQYNAAEEIEVSKTDGVKQADFLDGHSLKCKKLIGEKIEVFEVLPGIGWDNIQNTELSQVLSKKYYKCKLTEDGKYLIPDNVLLIPVKESQVDVFAEWFANMDEYKSVDSFSVNAGLSVSVGLAGLGGVSGSFGVGYQSAKMHLSKSTSTTFISRVQARYYRYRIVADPDSELHPSFKTRLLEIAESLYNHHTQLADYQSQLLIRDFGTHVLTRMDAGAVLYKEDHIDTKTNFVDDVKKRQWQIGAGASFSAIFDGVTVGGGLSFGMSKTKMEETINEFNNKTTFSVIKSRGGSYFDGNTTASEWTQSLDNELVSIDRDGIPVYELVSTATLPELPLDTLLKLGEGIKKAFISYYKHNTYRGCMDPRSKNYDIKANVVDNSVCGNSSFENEYFGGVYQTCVMSRTDAGDICKDKGYIQKNPLTGDFSCPKGYKSIELISEPLEHSVYHERHRSIWHLRRHSYTSYSNGRYSAYWCIRDPSIEPDQRYFFGGIFSTRFKPNVVTGGFSCPVDFIQLRLADDVYVCVSANENNIGIKFGGFFSCSHGNPLALIANMTQGDAASVLNGNQTAWPKRCAHGMVEQSFSITSDCELEFCSDVVTEGNSQKLPALKRPPFTKRPSVPPGNYTEMVIVADGKWYKNEAAFQKLTEMSSLEEKVETYQKAQDDFDRASAAAVNLYAQTSSQPGNASPGTSKNNPFHALPSYAVAIISSVATLVCVLAATLAVAKCRKRRRGNNTRIRIDTSTDELEHVSVETRTDYGAAGSNNAAI